MWNGISRMEGFQGSFQSSCTLKVFFFVWSGPRLHLDSICIIHNPHSVIAISWNSPAGFPANVRQHTGDWVLRRFLASLSLSVQMSKNLLQLCKQLFGQHYQFPGEVCCFLLWRFSFLGLSLHLLFMIWEIGIKSCTITYNTESLFLCMVRLSQVPQPTQLGNLTRLG